MSSVLNGSGMQQNSNLMMRGQIFNLQSQIKELSNTVDKLIDIIREISIKTDVSMDILESDVAVAQQPYVPPVVQPTYVQTSAPTLSGNLRRR